MTGAGNSSTNDPASSGGGGWGQTIRNSRQYALLKSAVRLLQDNRAATDDGAESETAERLKEINRSQNDSCPLVKSVLNCMFVTVGVVLLLGVVAVIIYTSIVTPGSDEDLFRNFKMMKTYVDQTSSNNEDENIDAAHRSSTISDNPSALSEDDYHHPDTDNWSTAGIGAQVDPIAYVESIPLTMNDDDSVTGRPDLPEASRVEGRERDRQKPSHQASNPVVSLSSYFTTKRPRSGSNGEAQKHLHGPAKKAVRCFYVPVVYQDESSVQLHQICHEVPPSSSASSEAARRS